MSLNDTLNKLNKVLSEIKAKESKVYKAVYELSKTAPNNSYKVSRPSAVEDDFTPCSFS